MIANTNELTIKILTIKVHMVANDHGKSIRMVRIPAPVQSVEHLLLDAVFMHGQNDFQPIERTCSVSVGDVIELNMSWCGKKLFIVQSMGFKEMTREELEEYKAIPARDRTWSKFVAN